MKPKRQYKGDEHKSNGYDRCATPAYALEPLLPYIPKGWTVWECAAGEGYLVEALSYHGYHVIGTDVLDAKDFFVHPAIGDVIITNPPYSVKYSWIKRCYELDLPFALLMPLETLGAASAQRRFSRYGIKLILMDKRVDFMMPNVKDFSKSSAQFPTAWFCWKIPGLVDDLTYAHLVKRDMRQDTMF